MDEEWLEELREDIDDVNKEIAEKAVERIETVEKIGERKNQTGMDVRDESRETEVKNQFAEVFESKGIKGGYGKKLAECLIEMARDYQREEV